MKDVKKEWAGDSKNFQTQLIPWTSPVDDHASNGGAETKLPWKNLLGSRSCRIPLVCRGWCDIRIFPETNLSWNPMAEKELTMSELQSPLLDFGGAVVANESGIPKGQTGFRRGILSFGWDERRGQMNILWARELE